MNNAISYGSEHTVQSRIDWDVVVSRFHSWFSKNAPHLQSEATPELLQIIMDADALFDNSMRATEQMRSQLEEESKSRLWLNSTFQKSPLSIVVLDEELKIMEMNKPAAAHWNLNPKSMSGMNFLSLLGRTDAHCFADDLPSMAEDSKSSFRDLTMIRPRDGSFFVMRVQVSKFTIQALRQTRYILYLSDMTEKRLIEKAQQKATTGLGLATGQVYFDEICRFMCSLPGIDLAIVAKWSSKKTVQFLAGDLGIEKTQRSELKRLVRRLLCEAEKEYRGGSVNRRFEFGQGGPLIGAVGDSLVRLTDSKTGAWHTLRDSSGELCGCLLVCSRQSFVSINGIVHILSSFAPRTSAEISRQEADQKLLIGQQELERLVERRTLDLRKNFDQLTREVERRRKTENSLIEARREAELATQAKSRFLANMSHEIRTPINGIIGAASLLAEGLDQPGSERLLEVIRQSGDSLLSLINDILDLTKLDAAQMRLEYKTVDILDFALTCFHVYEISLRMREKPIFFLMDLQLSGSSLFNLDPLRVRQIIDNLVTNANKFTSQGSITVKMVLTPLAGNDRQATRDFELLVSVVDTGIGMTEMQQESVFERFVQADSSTTRLYGGTGLGLPISRQLAELMGGSLACESQLGQGTEFRLKIPVRQADINPEKADLGCPNSILLSACEVLRHKKFCIAVTSSLVRTLLSRFISQQSLTYLEEDASRMSSLPANPDEDTVWIFDQLNPDLVHQWSLELLHSSSAVSRGCGYDLHRSRSFACVVCVIHNALFGAQLLLDLETVFRGRTSQFNPLIRHSEPKSLRSRGRDSALGGRKILLVEDNEVNRFVARRMLSYLGAEIVDAVNGADALAIFKEQDFDMVLMDCLMPVMDGYEAVRRLKEEQHCTVPVVAVTASALKGDEELCLSSGFDAYLSKPITLAELEKLAHTYFPHPRQREKAVTTQPGTQSRLGGAPVCEESHCRR